MTPEIKGDELVEKFRKVGCRSTDEIEIHSATQCAIICVEEINKVSMRYVTIDGAGENNEINSHEFWNEVLNYLKSKL